jgi:hypothetical protein
MRVRALAQRAELAHVVCPAGVRLGLPLALPLVVTRQMPLDELQSLHLALCE